MSEKSCIQGNKISTSTQITIKFLFLISGIKIHFMELICLIWGILPWRNILGNQLW